MNNEGGSSAAIVQRLNSESQTSIENLDSDELNQLPPRLKEFVLNYRQGHPDTAINQLKVDGYPIIEKTDKETYEVTFIYVGDDKTKNVVIAPTFNSAFLGEENRFNNIKNTPVWYKSYTLDPRIHCGYSLLVNVPDQAFSCKDTDKAMDLLPEFISDPLNPGILMPDRSVIRMHLAQQTPYVLEEKSSVTRAREEFNLQFNRTHFIEACPEDKYEIADKSCVLLFHKINMMKNDMLNNQDLKQLFNFDKYNQFDLLNKIENILKQINTITPTMRDAFLNLKSEIEKIVQNEDSKIQISKERLVQVLEPIMKQIPNQGIEYWCNVFTPKNFDINRAQQYPVMLIFDGYANFHHTNVQFSMDKLNEAEKCDDMILVFMEAERPNVAKFNVREESLACSDHYADFLAKQLLPYLQNHFNVSRRAEDHYLFGQSLGGVAAVHCAIRYPEHFGNVLSQSGAFWHHKLHQQNKADDKKENKHAEELLTYLRQFKNSPEKIAELRKVNFRITVGEFEYKNNYNPELDEVCLGRANDRLVDQMNQMGIRVQFVKQPGTGHDYAAWRVQFPSDLLQLNNMKMRLQETSDNKYSARKNSP